MKVIVDTSVWIDHFRRDNPSLLALLDLDVVLAHPMVLGELRCGSLPEPRATALSTLEDLEPSADVDIDEVIDFIEAEQIFGKGCGLVDLSLLMSTLKTPGARLWAIDKRLARLAGLLGVAYVEPQAEHRPRTDARFTAPSPTA